MSPTVPTLSRDRHLFAPGPKRILSLDGGGVRGAISIAFLEKLEKLIEEIEGKPTLLCDWFDLIGGTSTGAIIAGALALGYRAADVRKFYELLGPRVFRRPFWRIQGFFSKFDGRNLMAELEAIVGPRKLGTDDLLTGFCIVAKRLDTGSCWVISNNPKSKYWETPADLSFVGNRHYSLNALIRASAAAPYFFDPEFINIASDEPPGLFIDGALTPHNNPALQLLLYVALPQYGLAWPLGADNLTIVSVGTGYTRPRMTPNSMRLMRPITMAVSALEAQISEAQQLILTLMSWFGESPTGWPINSELGDVTTTAPPFNRPMFGFLRYDIRLQQEWLARELGVALEPSVIRSYERLDAPDNIPAIYELAARAAELQIKRDHLVRRPETAARPAG